MLLKSKTIIFLHVLHSKSFYHDLHLKAQQQHDLSLWMQQHASGEYAIIFFLVLHSKSL